MPAYVFTNNARGEPICREVENFGWFFRKARRAVIQRFVMKREADPEKPWSDWKMHVLFDDGDRYVTDYASLSVFKDVMDRQRSLQGVRVEIDGEPDYIIGSRTQKHGRF